ncbi:protein-L-isoaspartate O-methyltransferase [Croceicoccus sp. F390]|uniref:Protein-L-isoaspartate O-methyltransferase n=1 Tax=Croceicoccus esteveae TaxID=3075597 RepID=A0ABU2ZHT6_9SPHN|nr:protein-L-isoaspartate O-methyltransferase [Croceicoccus sp. F390]MDT0576155.1 protein-L-isoaspartate O-methyltransferase [Croceicoccus sp. F390]
MATVSPPARPQDDHGQDFARARRTMIESQLRPTGIYDVVVLEAMASIRREDFLPESLRSIAYMDRQIPLGGGRAMNSPLAQASLLQQARPLPGDKALLIGGGTGYMAAMLASQVGSLDVVEPDERLARICPVSAGAWHSGPLDAGWAANAPYTLVVIDGAVEHVPDLLVDQLVTDGRIVLGTVERGVTRLATGVRVADRIAIQPLAEIGMAVLPSFAREQGWSF